MDEYGNYIEHSNGDVLLSIPEEENSSFFSQPADNAHKPAMDRAKKDIYCTGVAFSVGFGVDVSAGPLSAGGEKTNLLNIFYRSCLLTNSISFHKVDLILGSASQHMTQTSTKNHSSMVCVEALTLLSSKCV